MPSTNKHTTRKSRDGSSTLSKHQQNASTLQESESNESGSGVSPLAKSRDGSSTLPSRWKLVRLGDVAKTTSGGTPRRDKPQFYGGNIPWVKSGELGDSVVYETSETITEEAIKSSNAKIFPKGTLCIALYGATVGKLGILGIDAATNQAVCAIFPPEGLDNRFLYRFFESKRRELVEQGKGGAQPNISQGIIRDTMIPLPPLPEQRRLVAEIEKQFSRLEEGVSALKRVQANLKRYRAAVLKAACEGKLVENEVKSQKLKGKSVETGEQLLKRILEARRKNWNGRGKYKEPVAPDTSKQPKLPEGWTWARIGQLFECIVPNRDKPRTFTGEIPWITLPDFSEATMIRTGSRKIGLSKAEVEEYNARVIPSGSVVMSCIGRFGLAAKIAQDSVVNQQLHAFVIPPFLPAEYFVYALRAGKNYMESIATSTTIAYLNKDNCNSVPIPLPPLAEQKRIVEEVERRLSVVEELESQVTTNLQRSTRLRQSILQKAFEGELV